MLVKKEYFDQAVVSICDNKTPFNITSLRRNKSLYKDGRMLFRNHEKQKKDSYVFSFYANVKKQLNKYIVSKDFIIDVEKKKNPVRHKKYNNWREVPNGSKFLHVDINNCYWQLMEREGYISRKMYLRYKNDASFKEIRIKSLTMTVSLKTKEYYFDKFTPGVPDLTIQCDNRLYKDLFENIRNLTTNLTGHICYDILKENYLGYNIDGLYLTDKDSMKEIHKFLKKEKMDYKIVVCQKIDSKSFLKGIELMSF